MLHQFYLLLLFSDPVEATIFGPIILGAKTWLIFLLDKPILCCYFFCGHKHPK